MAKEEHEDTVDVAESFVTAFYHDSDDEVVTEGDGDGDIFELYSSSRPLTPLERRNPEGTTTDRAQYSDDPSDQISVIDPEDTTYHEKKQSVREDIINPKPNVELGERGGENVAPASSPRTRAPENEATSKSSAEENTPVQDV